MHRTGWPEAAGLRCIGYIVEIHVLPVKAGGDITRLFAAFKFIIECPDHPILDPMAALGVNRMGDVGVQFDALMRLAISIVMALIAVFVEPAAAVVAVAGTQMIFFAAAAAMVRVRASSNVCRRYFGAILNPS